MSLKTNRWGIAIAGTLLQVCLGSVYAWSYFQIPLMNTYHWNNAQVSGVFSIAICFLGLAAAWGGMNMSKFRPRLLAITGGALFGTGMILAAVMLQAHSLIGLYLAFGVIGGTGLGLGYVTPVATVAKWFPDKKGLVTGMVIMGFGLGAFFTGKVLAPALMAATSGNLVLVFSLMGLVFLIVATGCGSLLRNPPAEKVIPADGPVAAGKSAAWFWSRQFWLMWGIFFCNIVAGIAIIGFQSPLLQDLLKKWNPALSPASLVSAGATLIAISSLCNGLGRLFWGGFSDHFGRVRTFQIILASQAVTFGILAFTHNPWVFAGLICYVLLCYGGGFGTMPAFVLDVYGKTRMPVIYGCLLTAWSMGGLIGPQMVAWLKDNYTEKAGGVSFLVGAGILAIGLILSACLQKPLTVLNPSPEPRPPSATPDFRMG